MTMLCNVCAFPMAASFPTSFTGCTGSPPITQMGMGASYVWHCNTTPQGQICDSRTFVDLPPSLPHKYLVYGQAVCEAPTPFDYLPPYNKPWWNVLQSPCLASECGLAPAAVMYITCELHIPTTCVQCTPQHQQPLRSHCSGRRGQAHHQVIRSVMWGLSSPLNVVLLLASSSQCGSATSYSCSSRAARHR